MKSMLAKVVCTCGGQFQSQQEWRVHYMLGEPGLNRSGWNGVARKFYDDAHQLAHQKNKAE